VRRLLDDVGGGQDDGLGRERVGRDLSTTCSTWGSADGAWACAWLKLRLRRRTSATASFLTARKMPRRDGCK